MTTADPLLETGLITGQDADIITEIEHFRVQPRWLFVRVETRKGYVGWGEATLEGHCEPVEGALDMFRKRFVGWDPANIEDIWQSNFRHRFYRGHVSLELKPTTNADAGPLSRGPVLMSATSGLDIALWDIKGKTLGVPVWQLLGGAVRNKCRVYGWVGGDRPSDVLEQAKVRKQQGFTALKMNATEDLDWLDSPSKLDATVERLAQIKSLGMDAGLDFHGRLHKTLSKQLAKALEVHRPLFIEEPLLPQQVPEMNRLASQTTIPIAVGERVYCRQDARPYFESGCIDIIQPDISHAGGISETKRIANMAECYDIGVAPHCPLGPIAFAASLQIGFSSLNFVICEMSWQMHYNAGDYDLFTYLKNPDVFKVQEGMISLMTKPGLGIELDEELIRRNAKESGDFSYRTGTWRGPDGAIREW